MQNGDVTGDPVARPYMILICGRHSGSLLHGSDLRATQESPLHDSDCGRHSGSPLHDSYDCCMTSVALWQISKAQRDC